MFSLFFGLFLATIALVVLVFVTVPEQIRTVKRAVSGILLVVGVLIAGSGGVGYNDAGHCTHIRTIAGTEGVKCDVGWFVSGWGESTIWPHYISIVHANQHEGYAGMEGPYPIRMSDNWSGNILQTTRFGIPLETEQFLKMAHDFRTIDRLVLTTLRPAVTSSLDSVANLYSMEEYWTGGKRDEFKTEYENAIKKGRPAVDREETQYNGVSSQQRVAPSSSEVAQDESVVGDDTSVRYITRKRVDANGEEIRVPHEYIDYGITVSSAIIEQLDPDNKFEERIQERKDAASRRIIAREQRLEQEEQRRLAITKAERDIAERQGQARVIQIESTTNAETEKKLALIQAERVREQANIDKQTSEINLQKARIDADAIKVTADASAYERERLLEADNALKVKVDAEVEIQKVWADAYAKRNVPQIVFGGGADGAPVGSDNEVTRLLNMLTVDTAKRLAYDRAIGQVAPPPN